MWRMGLAIAVLALAGACADNAPYIPPEGQRVPRIVPPSPGHTPFVFGAAPSTTPMALHPFAPNKPVPRILPPLPGPESYPLPGSGARAVSPADLLPRPLGGSATPLPEQMGGPLLFGCSGTGCQLYQIVPGAATLPSPAT